MAKWSDPVKFVVSVSMKLEQLRKVMKDTAKISSTTVICEQITCTTEQMCNLHINWRHCHLACWRIWALQSRFYFLDTSQYSFHLTHGVMTLYGFHFTCFSAFFFFTMCLHHAENFCEVSCCFNWIEHLEMKGILFSLWARIVCHEI